MIRKRKTFQVRHKVEKHMQKPVDVVDETSSPAAVGQQSTPHHRHRPPIPIKEIFLRGVTHGERENWFVDKHL